MPPFPLLGEPRVVELVNTRFASRGELTDGLRSRETLTEWLSVHGLPAGAARARGALPAVRALRDALAELFDARLRKRTPDSAAVQAVNTAARAAPSYPVLTWSGLPDVARAVDAPPLVRVLGVLAAEAMELLGGEDGERLHRCHGPGCVLLFLGSSRREWCSPECGNRARVARHYRRSRGEAEG